jgi:prepilin-type processing-associated H-X9-DG protein
MLFAVPSGASDASTVDLWDQAAKSRLTVLMCPSDTQTAVWTTEMGWTNYMVNHGSWVELNKQWDGVFGPNGSVTSGVPPAPFVKLANITDGTSNTAAMAEVCRGPNATPGTARDPRTDCFETPGAVPATSAAAARTYLNSQNWQTALFAGGNGWGQNPAWRYRGYPWREGSIWRTGYNHLMPPNTACWRPGPPNDWYQLITTASSFHTGGVNVLFCDGSVHFVSSSINADTWTAIGTRAGGETVDMSNVN